MIDQPSPRRHASGIRLILYRYIFSTVVKVLVTRPLVIFEVHDAVVNLKLSNIFNRTTQRFGRRISIKRKKGDLMLLVFLFLLTFSRGKIDLSLET